MAHGFYDVMSEGELLIRQVIFRLVAFTELLQFLPKLVGSKTVKQNSLFDDLNDIFIGRLQVPDLIFMGLEQVRISIAQTVQQPKRQVRLIILIVWPPSVAKLLDNPGQGLFRLCEPLEKEVRTKGILQTILIHGLNGHRHDLWVSAVRISKVTDASVPHLSGWMENSLLDLFNTESHVSCLWLQIIRVF